jgi:hypothetical protein
MKMETVIETGKWATFVSHVKANRIEYLLFLGLMHIAGITTKIYSQVDGVCI